MSSKRKKPAKKTPNDYPRFTFRLDGKLLAEAQSIADFSDMSVGQIMCQALRRYLPELARLHSKLLKP